MYKPLTAALMLSASLVRAQSPQTVLDGVYSTDQAARGERAYGIYCTTCHDGQDRDGPELTGPAFLDRWREDQLDVLFSFISTTMPGNQPGGLNADTYADVLAFLLKSNDFPAGTNELTAGAVGAIRLVGKEGPQPLPNLTVVRVIGCLEAGANDTWLLARAGEPAPVRSRTVDETTAEELKVSAARPLGAGTVRLQNVPASAAVSRGHKVQAKGVLIRQYNAERINVITLDALGPGCGQ